MVNQNAFSEIPFAGGRGFQRRPEGKFHPGEFQDLLNCEISADGAITNRPSIFAAERLSSFSDPFINPQKFMGYIGSYSIFLGTEGVYAVQMRGDFFNYYTVIDVWSPTSLSYGDSGEPYKDATGNLYAKPVACHAYNNLAYWIIFRQKSVSQWDIKLYKSGISHLDFSAIGGLTSLGTIISGSNTGSTSIYRKYTSPQIVSSFIHKERLWIVTENAVYFSKATDFTKWAVIDGGGLININDDNINEAVPLGDTIYLACDNSIRNITYNIDPNDINDIVISNISPGLGSQTVSVHDSVCYFVRNDTLYAVSGSSVSKVMDLNLGLIEVMSGVGSPFVASDLPASWQVGKVKLISYRRYLIIQNYCEGWYESTPSGSALGRDYSKFKHNIVDHTINNTYPPDAFNDIEANGGAVDPVMRPHSAWFLNMDTGCIHRFSVTDQHAWNADPDPLNSLNHKCPGKISEFFVYPSSDIDGSGDILLLNTKTVVPLSASPNYDTGYLYALDPNASNSIDRSKRSFDQRRAHDGKLQIYNTDMRVSINQFSPDDSEFFNKKFRSLLIEGSLPKTMNTYVSPGSLEMGVFPLPSKYLSEISPPSDLALNKGYEPSSIRLGLGIRSRSLSVMLFSDTILLADLTMTPEDFFGDINSANISPSQQYHLTLYAIGVLWLPSVRAPITSGQFPS